MKTWEGQGGSMMALKKALCFLIAVGVLLVARTGASAAAVITLAGTGFSATGTALANDTIDGNWTVTNSTSGNGANAYVVGNGSADSGYPTWETNTASNGFVGSSWLSETPSTISTPGVAGYSFNLTFSLAGYNLSDPITLNGSWCIDDTGTIALNGNVIASGSGIYSLSALTTNNLSYFRQNLNTLTITMTASDNLIDGVRFQGTINATAPEARTPTLLLGTAILGLLYSRRRSVAAL